VRLVFLDTTKMSEKSAKKARLPYNQQLWSKMRVFLLEKTLFWLKVFIFAPSQVLLSHQQPLPIMEMKKRHLQSLMYFAHADNHAHPAELDFIRQVGKRLGLDDDEVNIIINSKIVAEVSLPHSEVQRYILFDDILNLIAIDKKITDAEEAGVKKVATALGFSAEMAEATLNKLKRHIELGFDTNQVSHAIKNTLFSFTFNLKSHEKYSD